ncbi:MAG: RNA polymerase sigma factor [Cytophagaceae bacterium]|jgi:RNA polymerase sigma-70 factor (ECF subfamily)|nr:RNA polymerase sigma factor [Cytophagaceae bacterium]
MTKSEVSHIIQGCLQNDRQSQKILYNYLVPEMMRIGRRYTRNTEDLKDLVQDSMMKVFKHLNSFKGESAITTWANRIMINQTLNKITKESNKKFVDEDEPFSSIDVSSNDHIHIEGKLLAEDLLKFLEQLPEGKRVIFNLYVIDGYTHKEIAEMLNITESTSKAQLSKAKEILIKLHQKSNQDIRAKVY